MALTFAQYNALGTMQDEINVLLQGYVGLPVEQKLNLKLQSQLTAVVEKYNALFDMKHYADIQIVFEGKKLICNIGIGEYE